MDSTRPKVLGKHRLRVAVALAVLDRKPPHISISDYISSLSATVQARTKPARSARVRKSSSMGQQLSSDGTNLSPAPTDLGPPISDVQALSAAQSLSPTIAQIVSVLLAPGSSAAHTSGAVLSELLRLLKDSLEMAKEDGSVGAEVARVLCWLAESGRMEIGAKGQEGAVSRQLGAILSSLVALLPQAQSTSFPSLISGIIHSLRPPLAIPILPSVAESALSAFAELVRQLATESERREWRPRLKGIVELLELVIELDEGGAGATARRAREGLTRLIAELGVDELVGLEVESRVLEMLQVEGE